MTSLPTAAPASFVPLSAIAFSDDDKTGQAVSQSRPLPVRPLGQMDLYERMAREGEPVAAYGFGGPTSVAAGAVNSVVSGAANGFPSVVGKALWVESITVTTSSAAVVQPAIAGDPAARFNALTNQLIVPALTPVTIPVRRLLRPFACGSNYNVELRVRRLFNDDGTVATAAKDVYSSVSLNGYAITDDLNFDAEKTILAIGDSILNGTGPTKSANLWTFKVRDHLKSGGASVRIVQMANSGSTTSEHEAWRAGGRYDSVGADLVLYAVGANDASTGVAPAAYRANLEAFWNHARKRWPDALVVICGMSPVESNATHANAELLRAEAADFVADTSDARLKYVNLGAAFTRTDAGYYASTDTAGSRVHPDDDGHAAIAATFTAAADAQGIGF